MQYTVKLKRDVFLPVMCSPHLPLLFIPSWDFAPTPRVKIKKLFQKAAFFFFLQAEQSSLSHNSFNNFLW